MKLSGAYERKPRHRVGYAVNLRRRLPGQAFKEVLENLPTPPYPSTCSYRWERRGSGQPYEEDCPANMNCISLVQLFTHAVHHRAALAKAYF